MQVASAQAAAGSESLGFIKGNHQLQAPDAITKGMYLPPDAPKFTNKLQSSCPSAKNLVAVGRKLSPIYTGGTCLASFPRGIYAEEKMKTLFQAQESPVSKPSQSSTKSSARTRIAVLIGILVILGLAVWEGVAAALRATSGHSS